MAWRIRLTAAADADFHAVLDWTARRFGATQARAYEQTLTAALEALADGPDTLGARQRSDIGGLYTLHVARTRRRGRHIVVFRVAHSEDGAWIEVLRILHDSMDLARHLPPEED